MKRALLFAMPAVLGALLMTPGAQAHASGWAGSRYEQQDCRHVSNGGKPGLYCERVFVTTFPATRTIGIADETCPSGTRSVSRSGTIEESFKGYDYYDGPVPLAKFEIAGNESDSTDTWIAGYTDTDLGCIS